MTTPEILPSESKPPGYYRLVIDRSVKRWMTANQRLNHFARARQTGDWRDIAAWRASREKLPLIEHAHVICELRFCVNRRRDPANWAPTAKAVVDGLVDAHVFPDDNSRHVIGPDMRIGPSVLTKGEESLIVHIWRLEP